MKPENIFYCWLIIHSEIVYLVPWSSISFIIQYLLDTYILYLTWICSDKMRTNFYFEHQIFWTQILVECWENIISGKIRRMWSVENSNDCLSGGNDGNYCSALTNYCHETIPHWQWDSSSNFSRVEIWIYITYPTQKYWQSIKWLSM